MIFRASLNRSWSLASATRFSNDVAALFGVILKYDDVREGVVFILDVGSDIHRVAAGALSAFNSCY